MTLSLIQTQAIQDLRIAAERGLVAPDTAACAMAVAAHHDAAIFLTYEGELKVFEPDAPTVFSLPFAEWWKDYGAPRAARLAIAAQEDHSAA